MERQVSVFKIALESKCESKNRDPFKLEMRIQGVNNHQICRKVNPIHELSEARILTDQKLNSSAARQFGSSYCPEIR